MLAVSFQSYEVRAVGNYGPGSLLALEGVEGAAVYYISSDGNKYVFPDGKTYSTWYENFDDVVRVHVTELDLYPDGGVITYRPGTKLVTHSNTTKIYAVSPSGILHWIPTSEIAEELYGEIWYTMVQDVIPGYFSSSYTMGADLSDKHPEGTLIKYINDIYYVWEENMIRLFVNSDSFEANRFDYDDVVDVDDISGYTAGESITGEETLLAGIRAGFWLNNSTCSYSSIKGTIEILSIELAPEEEFNCPVEPRKVLLKFTPDNLIDIDNYSFPNVSDTSELRINDGKNPSLNWIEQNGIEVGNVYDGTRSEILGGSCSPVLFDFSDINTYPSTGCN